MTPTRQLAADSNARSRWTRAIGLALAVGSLTLAAACKTMDAAPSLKDVEAVERARFQAWIHADTAAMRPMLGDDLVYCHSTGQCQNKEQIMAAIGARETIYHKMDVMEMKPRAVAGAVVINGKLSIQAEAGGQVSTFHGIYTDVYVKRDGRWQMVSWQSTRLP